MKPIAHVPAGTLKFGPRDHELDEFAAAAGEDDVPLRKLGCCLDFTP